MNKVVKFSLSLPKAVKAKWLKALRSGEYKQSKHILHDPETGGFCCLGVLQHVTMDGEVEVDSRGLHRESPTNQFWEYIGANTEDGRLSDDAQDTIRRLMDKNDEYRHNFKRIADFIERNVGEH